MATQLHDRPAVSEHVALAMVDDALQSQSHRSLVPSQEATACLERVAAAIQDPVRTAQASSVASAADAAAGDALLVSAIQLVDALLDLRLILSEADGS